MGYRGGYGADLGEQRAISLTAVFGPASQWGPSSMNQQYLGRRQDPNTAGGGGILRGSSTKCDSTGGRLRLARYRAGRRPNPWRPMGMTRSSRRANLTLPNGIQTTYSYNPASQVHEHHHQLTAASSQINKADYVYNPSAIGPV